MALKQLSVFVDNEPGALADIAEVLANADINLRALSIADTETFGILRMIVNDNKMAVSVLKGKGYIVKENSDVDRREYHLKLSEKYYHYNGLMAEYVDTVMERMVEFLG